MYHCHSRESTTNKEQLMNSSAASSRPECIVHTGSDHFRPLQQSRLCERCVKSESLHVEQLVCQSHTRRCPFTVRKYSVGFILRLVDVNSIRRQKREDLIQFRNPPSALCVSLEPCGFMLVKEFPALWANVDTDRASA